MKEFKINIQDIEIIIFQDDDGCFIKPKIVVELEKQGTATKPAHEPICMARKPLAEKTVAENCLKWGTGGINIAESRVDFINVKDKEGWKFGAAGKENKSVDSWKNTSKVIIQNDVSGRFPANLILSWKEDEYILKDNITKEQKENALRWIYENA